MAEHNSEYDPFILRELFPDTNSVFGMVHPSAEHLAKSCVFAFDTNALLAPYLMTRDGMAEVRRIVSDLVKARRLFIPAQVVREFARNRSKKVAEAYEKLSILNSQIPPKPKLDSSVFQDLAEYRKLSEVISTLSGNIDTYRERLHDLLSAARNAQGDNAIDKFYAGAFSAASIIDHEVKDGDLLSDLKRRATHKIPPGFKDASKLDGGIGDVAIWHTLIRLATVAKANVVFVTNDEKPDWVVNISKDESICPRYELLSEFHRLTGRHFSILTFERFLAAMGSKEETVQSAHQANAKSEMPIGYPMDRTLHAFSDETTQFMRRCHTEFAYPTQMGSFIIMPRLLQLRDRIISERSIASPDLASRADVLLSLIDRALSPPCDPNAGPAEKIGIMRAAVSQLRSRMEAENIARHGRLHLPVNLYP